MRPSRVTRTILLVVLAAALLLPGAGLMAAQTHSRVPHGRQLFSPEVMDQIRTLLEQKKLDLRHLPKVPFELPVTRMVEKQLSLVGVKIAPHSLESICYENVYWNGGPTVASATNGTVSVWGSELGLYFAKASDQSHPVTFSFGDVPDQDLHQRRPGLRPRSLVQLHSSTSPTLPPQVPVHLGRGRLAGLPGLRLDPGWHQGRRHQRGLALRRMGRLRHRPLQRLGLQPHRGGLPRQLLRRRGPRRCDHPQRPRHRRGRLGRRHPGPQLLVPLPADALLRRHREPRLHWAGNELTILGPVDCSATGNAGSLLAVGSTLYVNSRPFWSYNPTINGWFYAGFGMPLPPPAEGMTVDEYHVPDFTDPPARRLTTTFTREGDDPIAWYGAHQRERRHRLLPGPRSPDARGPRRPHHHRHPGRLRRFGRHRRSCRTWAGTPPRARASAPAGSAAPASSTASRAPSRATTGRAAPPRTPCSRATTSWFPRARAGLAILNVSNGMNPLQAGALEGTPVTMVAASDRRQHGLRHRRHGQHLGPQHHRQGPPRSHRRLHRTTPAPT